jgi:hypothetical protein
VGAVLIIAFVRVLPFLLGIYLILFLVRLLRSWLGGK